MRNPTSRRLTALSRACLTVSIGLTLAGDPESMAAQELLPSEPILGWARNGTTEVELRDDSLHVWGMTGSVRTTRLHSDLVLQFEFRTEDSAQAYAWVRSAFGESGPASVTGYGVTLADRNNDVSRIGRLERRGSGPNIRHSPIESPSAPTLASDEWHTCEIRVENSTISVSIDGRLTDVGEGVETFVGHIGFTTHRGRLVVRNATTRKIQPPASAFADVLPSTAPGVSLPSVVRKVEPAYPRDLRDGRIQAVVVLEAIVLADGNVGAVRTVRSAHSDMDEEALGAAKQWVFKPATKNGVAVPVIVTIEMTFTP
jgi:TonB family protein